MPLFRTHNALLLGLCLGLLAAGSSGAASLDLNFDYRLTPADGAMGSSIATAHFEDLPGGGIELTLTNVASDRFPVNGSRTYISGLLLTFGFSEAQLPAIARVNVAGDGAESDRWEPVEDEVTVDGFTFTSELGFPRSEAGCAGCRLEPGDVARVRFVADTSASPGLPRALTVADLAAAVRGGAASAGAPKVMAAVKVRGISEIIGGEDIESVPTIVVAAASPDSPSAGSGGGSGGTASTIACDGAVPSRTRLWPANKDYVNVEIRNIVSPNAYSVAITGIEQDEPVYDGALGDRSRPDGKIRTVRSTGKQTAMLRAERHARGDRANGRIYTVRFAADNGSSRCTGAVRVEVPRSRTVPAVDDGLSYDSTRR